MRQAGLKSVVAAAAVVGLLVISGCGGSSGSSGSGGQASDAYKLASLDHGQYATDEQVAAYQSDLDQLDAYCRGNEAQIARMVYGGATKLTDEGHATSARRFMDAALNALASVTPRGNEDCVGFFALVMGAIRIGEA